MTLPVAALLGFALWTLLILFATVGVYRWSRILTGKTRISHWTADPDAGSGLYPRAMRAHMNCIENLPVFGTIVFVIDRVGATAPALGILSVIVLAARIVQSTIHIALEQTDRVIFLRFTFYFTQIVAMIAMVAILLATL
ncbi:MAPEG family protein [Pseudodonghicola flavimaris]|uniref:MAPEG family protein n=1 Tax=Pseudodonghicola flavimaris TaxID=3050036 RepID=A0ABT7EX30_9RHOB|nr:MAPEG family protein [Pseudodonghicola flavimaris]MDK3016900.1 MAPEG family protein [Pseudodonghicola flavimaris]